MFIRFYILSAAIRMLLDSKKENANLAGSLLDLFQEIAPFFYGETCQTFNTHSLSHICMQVNSFDPLSSLSCMPFESANYHLKRAIGPITIQESHYVGPETTSKALLQQCPLGVSIGGLTLKNEKEIAVKKGGSFDVLLTAQSFTWNSNNLVSSMQSTLTYRKGRRPCR